MSFYRDVVVKDKRFHSTFAINDLDLLEPGFRKKVQDIIEEVFKTHNVVLHVGETYRSAERQQRLFMAGATQLRTVGVHHYGLAVDLWILIDGQVNWKADYSILKSYAIKYKLVWGGDWGTPDRPHSFRDYDHLQAVAIADQDRLFAGNWYPDNNYVPILVG